MSQTVVQTRSAIAEKPAPSEPKRLPPYNVVLLDDDHHTYDYVIRMLMRLFGHSWSGSWRMARTVDTEGRVVVATTTKEHAELKCEQILAFGPDPDILNCAGSMSAVIEPCPQ